MAAAPGSPQPLGSGASGPTTAGPWSINRGSPSTGIVTAFEAGRGLGLVRADSGRELDFHCTAIADRSRDIEVGRRVTFVVAAGHRGRLEARGIVKC